MTTPNFPELKRLNLWVQAQDKLEPGARRWRQGYWVTLRDEEPMCKTAFCVAGAAIVRAGHKLVVKYDEDGDPETYLDDQWATDSDVARLANGILGIEAWGTKDIYASWNSAEDIDRYIRGIFDKHGVSYHRTKAAPDKDITVREGNQE